MHVKDENPQALDLCSELGNMLLQLLVLTFPSVTLWKGSDEEQSPTRDWGGYQLIKSRRRLRAVIRAGRDRLIRSSRGEILWVVFN